MFAKPEPCHFCYLCMCICIIYLASTLLVCVFPFRYGLPFLFALHFTSNGCHIERGGATRSGEGVKTVVRAIHSDFIEREIY